MAFYQSNAVSSHRLRCSEELGQGMRTRPREAAPRQHAPCMSRRAGFELFSEHFTTLLPSPSTQQLRLRASYSYNYRHNYYFNKNQWLTKILRWRLARLFLYECQEGTASSLLMYRSVYALSRQHLKVSIYAAEWLNSIQANAKT